MFEEITTRIDLEKGIAVIKTRRANLFNYVIGFRKGLKERGCNITREEGNQKAYYFYFLYNGDKTQGNYHAKM